MQIVIFQSHDSSAIILALCQPLNFPSARIVKDTPIGIIASGQATAMNLTLASSKLSG
ncbi:MAG: hypothetical protein COB33_006400 [Thiotrichaceae bacterium]|nr:hypothetical protein [Thiotrichaceae bacterium]